MTEEQEQERERQDSVRERNRVLKDIDFGFQIENFIASPIGIYLCRRAEDERKSLLEALAKAKDMDAVLELQRRIGVLDCWQHWIAEAFHAGEQAQKQLIESGN